MASVDLMYCTREFLLFLWLLTLAEIWFLQCLCLFSPIFQCCHLQCELHFFSANFWLVNSRAPVCHIILVVVVAIIEDAGPPSLPNFPFQCGLDADNRPCFSLFLLWWKMKPSLAVCHVVLVFRWRWVSWTWSSSWFCITTTTVCVPAASVPRRSSPTPCLT